MWALGASREEWGDSKGSCRRTHQIEECVELKTRGEPLRFVVVICRENHRRVCSSRVILPAIRVVLAVINLAVGGANGQDWKFERSRFGREVDPTEKEMPADENGDPRVVYRLIDHG